MNNPLVSIIIPTYNRAHLIGETLDSIVAQTYTYWECIIVDDGSTDDTVDVIHKYIEKDARFQYHIRPRDRPKGGNAARNYGFEVSKGEYIQWFDSDDLMYNDLLLKKVNKFISQPYLDYVICGLETIDYEKKVKDFKVHNVTNFLTSYLNDELILNSLNILWRRYVVEVTKWDCEILKYQDLDFIFRVLYDNKYKGEAISAILITVRIHKNSISKDIDKKHCKSVLKVRERMYLLSLNKMNQKIKHRLYHLYLIEYRNVLSTKNYNLCFYVLKETTAFTNLVKLNLLKYTFLHIITKRGLVKLTNYINTQSN